MFQNSYYLTGLVIMYMETRHPEMPRNKHEFAEVNYGNQYILTLLTEGAQSLTPVLYLSLLQFAFP
jgi:hypothetical protein